MIRRHVLHRRAWLAAAGLVATLTLAGCVHSTNRTVETTTTTTTTTTRSVSAPDGPVDTRPLTAQDATRCPLLDEPQAQQDGGMRLARIEVLRRGSAVAGCRFYAIQGSSLASSEHLPGPNQPVIEISSARYASTVAAHNALVRLVEAGTEASQYTVTTGVIGVAFRSRFDPADGARDWSFGFAKGTTLVVVRTATDVTSLNARTLAGDIVGEFR